MSCPPLNVLLGSAAGFEKKLEVVDLITEITQLSARLPVTVLEGEPTDKLYHVFTVVVAEDEWSTFNRRFDVVFGEDCRNAEGRLGHIRCGQYGMDAVCTYLAAVCSSQSSLPYDLMSEKLRRLVKELQHLVYVEVL